MSRASRKYQMVAEAIIRKMNAGNGRLNMTQMQLAEEFGVNRQTVRHALDWLEAEGRLTHFSTRAYSPTPAPEVPRLKLPKIGYPVWAESMAEIDLDRQQTRFRLIREIHLELLVKGFRLDVQLVGPEKDPDLEKIERLRREWSALIMEPLDGDGSITKDNPFRPIINRAVIFGVMRDTSNNCVSPDFHAAGQIAIDEFVRLGVRRILYTGHREESVPHLLMRVASAETARHRHRNVEILYADGGHHVEEAFSAVKRFFLEGGQCEGILASTAYAGVGALRALTDLKIIVPEQMQLITIGTNPLSGYLSPRFTAITTRDHSLAREIAHMAIALSRPNPKLMGNILVPVHLGQGETTRAVYSENSPLL